MRCPARIGSATVTETETETESVTMSESAKIAMSELIASATATTTTCVVRATAFLPQHTAPPWTAGARPEQTSASRRLV